MHLQKLHIINYRNIAQADIALCEGINCFVGKNGAGKTNILDTVYYLSFCKSYTSVADSLNILHEQPFMVIQGEYLINGVEETIYCGIKRGRKKQFKRNKTDYIRLTDHIGLLPLVIIAPADEELIADAAESRRKYMDYVISQSDPIYFDAIMRYAKTMQNRNQHLKALQEKIEEGMAVDYSLLDIFDEQMASIGQFISQKRRAFVEWLRPMVQQIYGAISSSQNEAIDVSYLTGLDRYDLLSGLRESRQRDLVLGYTSRGIHKDDIIITSGGYPMKQVGSQGQRKSFVIALKLAQYRYLEHVTGQNPILLLDDVFDKLDGIRGDNLIRFVSSGLYGQIFISDTNKERLTRLRDSIENKSFKIFDVAEGVITESVNQ
ncbi:MAG: DNA replication and repair protein RecF [Bacteroidales bacterium]|nr:DNA replication and repair protein RecF [Bacteroidales bacterium]